LPAPRSNAAYQRRPKQGAYDKRIMRYAEGDDEREPDQERDGDHGHATAIDTKASTMLTTGQPQLREEREVMTPPIGGKPSAEAMPRPRARNPR
jgi:hypothetical protein